MFRRCLSMPRKIIRDRYVIVSSQVLCSVVDGESCDLEADGSEVAALLGWRASFHIRSQGKIFIPALTYKIRLREE